MLSGKQQVDEINAASNPLLEEFEQSPFSVFYHKTAIAHLFLHGKRNQNFEEIHLEIEPLTREQPPKLLEQLLKKYEDFLKECSLNPEILRNEKKMIIRGYKAQTLIGGEAGIHIFHPSPLKGFPVRVRILNPKTGFDSARESGAEIIRDYYLYSKPLIKDHRTQTFVEGSLKDLNPDEFLVWLVAGWPTEYREFLWDEAT